MPSDQDRQAIRDSIARIGRLSDRLIRLGPLSLGIDGVLSWIPGVGEIYSAGAAAFILVQGARAEAPVPTLVVAAALMACRTAISTIPLAGAVAADIFTAHRWAAAMIVRAIDRQLEARDSNPPPQGVRAGRKWAPSSHTPSRQRASGSPGAQQWQGV